MDQRLLPQTSSPVSDEPCSAKNIRRAQDQGLLYMAVDRVMSEIVPLSSEWAIVGSIQILYESPSQSVDIILVILYSVTDRDIVLGKTFAMVAISKHERCILSMGLRTSLLNGGHIPPI